ncbi:MAG: allophanate hydrolase subunit 1 [Intrasporangiaceae bacterium]|nr:allophanate hydrolase subunit 1 [Intrasporangiaceae bacterium]
MGDAAILVETGDIDDVLALALALSDLARSKDMALAEVTDIVPAARTVLIIARHTSDLPGIGMRVRRLAAGLDRSSSPVHEHVIKVPVRYDGPDLDDVARITGLSEQEVVAAHTGSPWRVGFGGFAPGFAYLLDGDPRLVVPRRASPRTSVPVGAVGLAGEFSGIYPRSSPGGWQLIGSTDVVLWDADRDPPALLQPGATVHFMEAS